MSLDRVEWEHIIRVLVEMPGQCVRSRARAGHSLVVAAAKTGEVSGIEMSGAGLRQFAAGLRGAALSTLGVSMRSVLASLIVALFAAFSAAWPATAGAQQSVDSATITGRTTDPSGAALVGASVSVRHIARNQGWNTRTDGRGRFTFLYLTPGGYELSVQAPGFADSEGPATPDGRTGAGSSYHAQPRGRRRRRSQRHRHGSRDAPHAGCRHDPSG